MDYANGRKNWYFPDCEMPPQGDEPLKGHESVIILNDNDSAANICLTLFFTDREPLDGIHVTIMPGRVRCLRLDNPDDLEGIIIPRETQYAMKLASDMPVTVQYGRLDTRQIKMAFYASSGYSY